MNYRVVNVDEFKVVGMQYQGESAEPIKKLWDDFMNRYKEVKCSDARVSYGVCEMVGSSCKEMIYVAACPVANFDDIPEGMVGKTVPGGKYAVFTHVGSLENLNETYDYIYGEWAKKGEEKMRHAPEFELYDDRFKYGQADSEMDIYVAIE